MQDNIISPKERLMIASEQLAGMQAPGYAWNPEQMKLFASDALESADELIKQSGCIVQGTEQLEHSMD